MKRLIVILILTLSFPVYADKPFDDRPVHRIDLLAVNKGTINEKQGDSEYLQSMTLVYEAVSPNETKLGTKSVAHEWTTSSEQTGAQNQTYAIQHLVEWQTADNTALTGGA